MRRVVVNLVASAVDLNSLLKSDTRDVYLIEKLLEMTESAIVSRHVAAGRLYPRPRDKCDHCDGQVILCWGTTVVKPYWRHPSDIKTDGHTPSCESALHKLAKKLLCDYLTGGGKCQFNHACDENLKTIGSECVKFVEENTYKDIRWDIGCLGEDNLLKFGIEIRVTHQVEKITTRNDVPWVELDATEIINHLDSAAPPSELIFRNLSISEPCCIEKLRRKEQVNVSQPPRDPVLPTTEPLSYRRLRLKEVSNLELARKLRFLIDEDREEWQVLHMMAMRGKIIVRSLWTERGYSKTYETDFGKEFLSRSKCLRCEKHHKVESCFKPYCTKCYYLIKNDDVHHESTTEISQELKTEIRNKLSWMFPIANGGDFRVPCSLCSGVLGRTSTWWFGERKRICKTCFDKECRYRNLYKLIPKASGE